MTAEPLNLAEMEADAAGGHVGPCEDVLTLITAVRERDAVIARVVEVLRTAESTMHDIAPGVHASDLQAALEGEGR